MKIQQFGAAATGAPQRTRPGQKGGAFASHLSDSQAGDETGRAVGASPLSGVGSLLLAQEENDQHTNRTLLTIRAETLLEQLEDMRFALLGGGLPPHKLQAMQKLVASRKPQVEDKHLSALLNDIELRVRVELAKLGF